VGDLSVFVLDAVRADLGHGAVERLDDSSWALKLGGPWAWDLTEIPGYDEQAQVVRLTTDAARERDASNHALGFLGRAHPLVRRALDRVRNVQFGGAVGPLDRRVSAARHDGPAPELLAAFLGRVASERGRELERVVALRVGRGGAPAVFADQADWVSLAAADRAMPTAGIWEKTFAPWAEPRLDAARAAASEAFARLAETFRAEHEQSLGAERRDLDQWFDARVGEICIQGPELMQASLFAPNDVRPDWRGLSNPRERLAAFATDQTTPARARAEAQTLLSLYERRRADLDARGRLQAPTLDMIGLLMLVPDVQAKGGQRGA
jgi:hypothetical protein